MLLYYYFAGFVTKFGHVGGAGDLVAGGLVTVLLRRSLSLANSYLRRFDRLETQVAGGGAHAHRFLLIIQQRDQIGFEGGIVPHGDRMYSGRAHAPVGVAKRIP